MALLTKKLNNATAQPALLIIISVLNHADWNMFLTAAITLKMERNNATALTG